MLYDSRRLHSHFYFLHSNYSKSYFIFSVLLIGHCKDMYVFLFSSKYIFFGLYFLVSYRFMEINGYKKSHLSDTIYNYKLVHL